MTSSNLIDRINTGTADWSTTEKPQGFTTLETAQNRLVALGETYGQLIKQCSLEQAAENTMLQNINKLFDEIVANHDSNTDKDGSAFIKLVETVQNQFAKIIETKKQMNETRQKVIIAEKKAIECARQVELAQVAIQGKPDIQKLNASIDALFGSLKTLATEEKNQRAIRTELHAIFDTATTHFSEDKTSLWKQGSQATFIQQTLQLQLLDINERACKTLNTANKVEQVVVTLSTDKPKNAEPKSTENVVPSSTTAKTGNLLTKSVTKQGASTPSTNKPTTTPSSNITQLSLPKKQGTSTPSTNKLKRRPSELFNFSTRFAQLTLNDNSNTVEDTVQKPTTAGTVDSLARSGFQLKHLVIVKSTSQDKISSPLSPSQVSSNPASPKRSRHHRRKEGVKEGVVGEGVVGVDGALSPDNQSFHNLQEVAQDKAFSQWPSFSDLIRFSGIGSTEPITPKQLAFLKKFNQSNPHKQVLAWELMSQNIGKINTSYLNNNSNFQKILVNTKDKKKGPFTLYQNKDFVSLVHFSNLTNASKILTKEAFVKDALAKKTSSNLDQKTGDNSDYFWNCQLKICASVMKFDMQSYFSATKKEGFGFVINVPDPHLNILHTFPRDTLSPTYVSGSDAVTVSGSTGRQTVTDYNNFMLRYSAVASYVYTLFQETEKVKRLQEIKQKLCEIHSALSKCTNQHLIEAMNKISEFSIASPTITADLEAIFGYLSLGTNSIDFDIFKKDFIEVLKNISPRLKTGSKEIIMRDAMTQVCQDLMDSAQSTLRPVPFNTQTHVKNSTSLEVTQETLLLRYLTETISMVKTMLKSDSKLEELLFKQLFRRNPNKDTVESELNMIHKQLTEFCNESASTIRKKENEVADLAIFARLLTPNELVKATKQYNEVNIRSHVTSQEVGAAKASFQAVAIESSSVKNGVISDEIAALLEQAGKAGLPFILI